MLTLTRVLMFAGAVLFLSSLISSVEAQEAREAPQPSDTVMEELMEALPLLSDQEEMSEFERAVTEPVETGSLQMPQTTEAEAPAEKPSAMLSAEQTQAAREFSAGLTSYNQADFPTAAGNFEASIRSNPDQVETYFFLGYALYKLKSFDDARVAFAEAYQRQADYLPPVAIGENTHNQ